MQEVSLEDNIDLLFQFRNPLNALWDKQIHHFYKRKPLCLERVVQAQVLSCIKILNSISMANWIKKSCIQPPQRYMEVHILCNVQLFSPQKVDFYMVSSRGRNQIVGQPPQIFILSLDKRQAIWEMLPLIFMCFALHQTECPISH